MIDRFIIMLLSVAVIAAMAIGCGGDSDGNAGLETSSLSKAQFVKQAEAICAEGSEEFFIRLTRYMQKHKSPSKSEGEQAADGIRNAVLPAVEAQLEEIEDLGAPAGDAETLEAFYAAQRRSIADLEKRKTLSLTTDLDPAFKEPAELARQYGIDACAYG